MSVWDCLPISSRGVIVIGARIYLMGSHCYFPATETENNGIAEHEDGNCFTFVFQDDVGGLEVCKNKEWIPIIPHKAQ